MTRPNLASAALFVDFDGTIVDKDTAEVALDRFGDPDWVRIEEALERGEVSFEESLRQEFARLRARPEAIIAEVSRVTSVRPNFGRLIDYCRSSKIPLTVVSGGLDFCIRHFLGRDDWLSFVRVYAPASRFTGSGYIVTFPGVVGDTSTNFKDDLVRREKTGGKRVFFVGNGFGDLPAAKEATFAFAIRGSKLAELCREQQVQHEEIDNFAPVVDHLSKQLQMSL